MDILFLLLFCKILFPFAKIGFYLQAKNVKIASIFIINNIFLFAYCTLNVYIVLLCKLSEFSNAFRVTFTSAPSTGS